ncbi:glycosyltransferase family 39 protein [Candidatus Gottesmanbacteria bacterium]|nr:glycosyltransferase family 39 protein [Candidatus Gottesmanbacteria bacterium]
MKPFVRYSLISIIIIAAILRLYGLRNTPPGVNRDEASIGVTAYSLMTTGKDEYGRTFPLSFESFGDWKLPLYIYMTIPFVKIFGLSELAVRLPSALAGSASVALLFFLARMLFSSSSIALVAALSLALMPWHIHISRVESEAVTAVFFCITGSLLFLTALRNKSVLYLTLAAILFALTYWTYHGTHISTTLLLLGIVIIYWKDIIRVPRWWVALAAGGTLTLTILAVTFSADHTKISGISIFGDPTVIHKEIELPRLLHDNPNSIATRLMHNRVTYAIITVTQNYLKSYGSEFLFIKGGGNRAHNIQGYGNLHPIEAALLIAGISWLISQLRKKESKFILWWIATGAVAAAITKDAPHSNRMLAVVPSFAIAAGAGFHLFMEYTSAHGKKIAILVLIAGYMGSMGYYLDRYFVHFPKNEATHWGYAYKKLTPVLFSDSNKNKNVIMTHPETSPYIYLMFYSGYNPGSYQKQATRYPISRDGFSDVSGFGRFSFRAIDWQKDLAVPNTLLIAKSDEVPRELQPKVVAEIQLPDATPHFTIIDTDK